MRFLRRSLVEAQVIPACCLQAFVAENGFDMTNWAPVEKQLSGGGVAQNVRRHLLANSGQLAVTLKVAPDVIPFEAIPAILANEKNRGVVVAGFDISFDPDERAVCKEDCAFFVSLANNSRLAPLEINTVPIER